MTLCVAQAFCSKHHVVPFVLDEYHSQRCVQHPAHRSDHMSSTDGIWRPCASPFLQPQPKRGLSHRYGASDVAATLRNKYSDVFYTIHTTHGRDNRQQTCFAGGNGACNCQHSRYNTQHVPHRPNRQEVSLFLDQASLAILFKNLVCLAA